MIASSGHTARHGGLLGSTSLNSIGAWPNDADDGRLLPAALDPVVMRRVRDASDEAAGRHRNGGRGLERFARIHPPGA